MTLHRVAAALTLAASLSITWVPAVAAAAPQPAPAQKKSATLDAVDRRGALACGVTANTPGFATQDDKGVWSGFDVDFCRALAAAIFDDPAKLRILPLAPKERVGALQQGQVDVLASGAPWTESRDAGQHVLYAAVSFHDGQGFLVGRKLGVPAAKDLGDATVCVAQGTSFELDLSEYIREHKAALKPRPLPGFDEAVKDYEGGVCDALSADIATLYATRARLADPEKHDVLPDLVAKASRGPIVRQGDDQWLNVVRWVLFAMLDAEEAGVAKTNVDEALKSESPDIRRLLGVDGDHGDEMGLEADFAYRVVKHVGNYGEVFERNLGQGSPLLMERRLNALWSKGGLLYAPPVR